MPAQSRRVYVISAQEKGEHLSFAPPSWWDVHALFQTYRDRILHIPGRERVLFLEWVALMDFDLATGRKTWSLPEHPAPEGGPQDQELLDQVQVARWFIITPSRVWIVPENAIAGCAIFHEPFWWLGATYDEAFGEWWRAWHVHHRDRFMEESNLLWMDRAALFTGEEIRTLDTRARETYRKRAKEVRRPISRQSHREMQRIARILENATWVVFYDYEWESGLD